MATEVEVKSMQADRKFNVKRHETDDVPTVSIIVPIYNADYTLRQALESLCNQTLGNLEIICVNDASPDTSAEIIEEFYQKDDRFVVVTHKDNAGYGASMNDGIQCACGTWVGILEPDDYVLPEMYESMVKVSGRSGYVADIVKTPYWREVREEGTKRGDSPVRLLNCSYRHRIHPASQPFRIDDSNANHLLRHHPSIWSALYRRSFLRRNELRFVEYPGSGWADNEFFYETLLAASSILYLDKPFYVYREETDEEYNAFARSNKHLPFDRWHSMLDIIDKRGYGDDDGIGKSHISKGFTYLSGEISANTDESGALDAEVEDEMKKMFSKMDSKLVDQEPKINLGLKKKFFEYCQYDDIDINMLSTSARYYAGLVGEFAYTLRNNGIGYAMKQVKKILLKH